MVSAEARCTKQQHTAPCGDCPWARKSIKGWLGPYSVEEWKLIAHRDVIVDCHTRKESKDKHWQCAGMAIYRANVVKRCDPPLLSLPKNETLVFSWGEFEAHHSEKAL
jgi:hypothetical protein